MTKDLALSVHGAKMERKHWQTTTAYIAKVKDFLENKLRKQAKL